jgi:hypothetical protein
MQPVELDVSDDMDAVGIQPGNKVKLTTRTGEEHFITVSSVTKCVIEGDGMSFNIEDIENIEKSELTGVGKAGVFSAAFVLGVGYAYFLQVFVSVIVMAVAF